MNDLGPEARSILEAARGAEAPTRADRQRIKHAVLFARGHLGAVSTTAGGAVAMSLAAKVTVAALTVAVLGGARLLCWLRKERAAQPPVASARVASRTAHVSPSRPGPCPKHRRVVEEPSAKPVLPEVRRREVARPEVRPAEPVSAPVTEVTPAARARTQFSGSGTDRAPPGQEDLRAGLPAQALRGCRKYDRRFGKGALEQERQALAAIALCQASPRLRGPGPGRGFSTRCRPNRRWPSACVFGVQAILTRFQENPTGLRPAGNDRDVALQDATKETCHDETNDDPSDFWNSCGHIGPRACRLRQQHRGHRLCRMWTRAASGGSSGGRNSGGVTSGGGLAIAWN